MEIILTDRTSKHLADILLVLSKRSIGHYFLPLRPNYKKVESDVCLRTYGINSKLEKERLCALKKLHEQMAHPAQFKLEALIRNAGKWTVCMKKELEMIYSQCETCKVLAKTPARSVVAMPRASTFNEVLALDLKLRGGKVILHMIDHFSRLRKGVFTKNKKPAEVVNSIMLHWVAGGFGRPASLHSDVGGEFTYAEVTEMAERLRCRVTSTAGDSPHINKWSQ